MLNRTWKYGSLALVFTLLLSCSAAKKTPTSTGSSAPASGGGGSSGGSSSPGGSSTSITAPSGAVATGTSTSTMTVTWLDNSTNETGFNIYRSTTSGAGFVLVGTVTAGVQTYPDTGLATNTTYYYRITAFNGTGESSASTEVSGTTLLSGAPSNLDADAISSTSIRLSWVDNSTSETAYVVERSFTSGGAAVWVTIATLPASSIRYTDTGLHPGNTYFYRVTASGLTPTATSNIDYGTTFSGEWGEISGSATGNGIFTNTADGSAPSVAMDDDGILVAVWEQNYLGTDAIYMSIFDPNALDDNGVVVGWKPAAVNVSIGEVTVDNGAITGVETTYKQTSSSGQGLSVSNADAQKPKVVYDSTRDEFLIVWQEFRGNHFEIVGRRLRARHANMHYNKLLGYYNVAFSDAVITDNNVATTNQTDDDAITTSASTWVLSTGTTTTESLRPDIASIGGLLYAVWEEYIIGTRTWQVYGSTSTIGATAVYPAIPAMPAVAAMDAVGLTSNTGTGISNAAATRHARLPSVTATTAARIYVAWQSTDAVNGDWDISTNFCDGNNFTGAQVTVANAGNSQNPRLGSDITATTPLPYLAWEDNSLTNRFNVYVLQGNAAGVVWSNLTASGVTSGDTTTTGISASVANAQFPTVAVRDSTVTVAWQDTGISGIPNIYAKRYLAQDSVPGEDASWVGLAGSDEGSGVTSAVRGAYLPELKAFGGDSLGLIYQNRSSTGAFQTYMLAW